MGDDTIPKELESICLKTLSKQTSERGYTTAKDVADELRHFLAQRGAGAGSLVSQPAAILGAAMPGSASATTASATKLASVSQLLKIVPRGLALL